MAYTYIHINIDRDCLGIRGDRTCGPWVGAKLGMRVQEPKGKKILATKPNKNGERHGQNMERGNRASRSL